MSSQHHRRAAKQSQLASHPAKDNLEKPESKREVLLRGEHSFLPNETKGSGCSKHRHTQCADLDASGNTGAPSETMKFWSRSESCEARSIDSTKMLQSRRQFERLSDQSQTQQHFHSAFICHKIRGPRWAIAFLRNRWQPDNVPSC